MSGLRPARVAEPSHLQQACQAGDPSHWRNRLRIAPPAAPPTPDAKQRRQPYKNYGVNHIGWVVDDFDAAIGRKEAAGCRESIPGDSSRFRQRAHYCDSAGFEWEIVAYLTENPAERYFYEAK